jgi:hypothetical protein
VVSLVSESPRYPWSLPTVFGTNAGPPALLSPTMIESNFGSPGNLEVICNVVSSGGSPNQLYHF